MGKYKKKFLYLFLFLFFIIGSLSSLNIGISHDEFHEQANWEFNLNLSKKISSEFFLNKNSDLKIENYKDKYYGIGFQLISQPIQYFLKDFISKYQNISEYGSKLVSKHFVVFLFFFISGIILYSILKRIIKNKNFCYFSTILYFLYPYLFGQSLFNSKDIPFMTLWLICSYLSFSLFEKFSKQKIITSQKIIVLGILTAYLFSIRISGILILLQYSVSFLIFLNTTKIKFSDFFLKNYQKLVLFILVVTIFTYLLHPVYWNNPFEIINAIKSMSYFYNDVCTKTLGSCMKAKDLPSTYLIIWLSVKLPLIILVGLLLVPLTEKKIFIDHEKNIFFGTILIISLLIPILFIFLKTNLYDEIRHILFLIPFYFMIGTISLFIFSRKIFYFLGVLTISIFTIENIKIHPYQYVWFNLPSRFIDLTNQFELDYQGLSGKVISKKITDLDNENTCILTSPIYSVEPFLNRDKHNCFDIWQYVDTNYQRPFLAVQHVRNIKKGTPYNCSIVYESGFYLLFHKKKFVTGKLLKCS